MDEPAEIHEGSRGAPDVRRSGHQGGFFSRYAQLSHRSPWLRKASRHLMYQMMARFARRRDWTFMNYGYAPRPADAGTDAALPHLETDDEPNRYCIQLYHHVVGSVDLRDRRVLEIGSGRGGGSRFLQHYYRPAAMVGVDFSKQAVRLCRRTHKQAGLSFVHGDAEDLPLDPESFDVVVNVESSHCYASMARFVGEVTRVLRPGGHFLFADFRPRSDLPTLDDELTRTGLSVISRHDITDNVLAALDGDNERKVAQIHDSVDRLGFAEGWLLRLMEEFGGSPGSAIYDRFRRGESAYLSYALVKPPLN